MNPKANPYANPYLRDILGAVEQLLTGKYGVYPAKHGKHITYPLKLTDVYTFEQDFIWTMLSKYPDCNDIANTSNPEIKIIIGKEEIQNDYVDIQLISDATHPLRLPQPMYIKKGTPVSFSNVSIATPDDVHICFGGFHPVKESNYNPVLFKHPYFKVARFTGVTRGTRIAPVTINFEDWEDFTATHVVAIVRENDTDAGRLLITNESFNLKIEVWGRDIIHRETHSTCFLGTPRYPRELNPPLENLTSSHIVTHIYPPSTWGDTYAHKVYVIYYGIMKYRLEFLPKRFAGTVNQP